MILAAALVVFCAMPLVEVLSISNRKNPSEKIYSRAGRNGFVVSYTHSVNKGRIHDFYAGGNDGNMVLLRSGFVSYGAGITEPDEIAGGVFTERKNGYELGGMNKKLSRFLLAVGVIADHSVVFCSSAQAESADFDEITESGEEYFLKDYFPVQTSLEFKIRRVCLFDFLTTKNLQRSYE